MKNNLKDRDLIAYCGLYCGDCFGYRGKVFKNYKQCYEVLGAMVIFRCQNAVKEVGVPLNDSGLIRYYKLHRNLFHIMFKYIYIKLVQMKT